MFFDFGHRDYGEYPTSLPRRHGVLIPNHVPVTSAFVPVFRYKSDPGHRVYGSL